MIQSQEKDLEKTKKERLRIEDIISKEKETISIKTKEEHEKLKIQSTLAKQIIDEKIALEEIKQKRKKIQNEIKSEKQKLKEQKIKIKKEILEKN